MCNLTGALAWPHAGAPGNSSEPVTGLEVDGAVGAARKARVWPGRRLIIRSLGQWMPRGLLSGRLRVPVRDRIHEALLVVDENDKLVGALNMHDLLRAGVL